jgi:hypothetical protein
LAAPTQAGHNPSENTTWTGRSPHDDIDAEIFSLLRNCPVGLIRVLAEALAVSASTVYSHLIEKMGFKDELLRWIPHVLTEDLHQGRVDLSRKSL